MCDVITTYPLKNNKVLCPKGTTGLGKGEFMFFGESDLASDLSSASVSYTHREYVDLNILHAGSDVSRPQNGTLYQALWKFA